MDEFRGAFPSDLEETCTKLAQLVGMQIKPEAATLNYYAIQKMSMGAHKDDAEDALERPIVSCSFGNTIIFLIGGQSRDTIPHAFYVRSGDVVIMGGPSRSAYHAVPCMLQFTSPLQIFEALEDGEDESSKWKSCVNYIRNSRININVRQVRNHMNL